jgi:serine/threonine protein kinase
VGGIYRTADGKVYRILYYVMKIAENGELFRLINQSEIFSERTSRYIFRQLIAGVKHLHKKGLAHCDIKTENILLDTKLNIKIADFGFSRAFINADQNKINYNSLENAIGSAKCNAPEITNDPKENSFHADEADIFACGCLLFEIVMKAPPFKTSDLKD